MEMKLVIKRDMWIRGTGDGSLRRGPKMCILGFYCAALGVPPDLLEGESTPADVVVYKTHGDEWADAMQKGGLLVSGGEEQELAYNSPFVDDAVNANDRTSGDPDAFPNEAEREAYLTRLFARKGVHLEFTE